MGQEFEELPSPPATVSPPDQSADPPPPPPEEDPSPPPLTQTPPFDPRRMIGIIRRKALIKDLAAVYHSECLSYCQQLLELQKQTEEPFADMKHQEDARKVPMRPPKRSKKVR